MTKITVNIEAETTEELQAALKSLIAKEASVGSFLHVPAEEQGEEKTKAKPKTKTKPKTKEVDEKKEEVSTESTSDTEPSETGEAQGLTESDEPETSATPNKYPNAAKSDVTKAVKKALSEGQRESIRTALERQGVAKVPELNEGQYGVFMTDLEALVGENKYAG